MCRLAPVALLSLVALAAPGCSCDGYASGKPAVVLSATPLRLDFGATWTGEEVVRELALRNGGHREAQLRIALADPDFAVDPAELSIPSGGEALVAVSFRPSAEGTRQLELPIVGAGDRVEALLPVEGQGIAPAIELPEELDFGTVVVGEREALQIVVRNRAPLAVPAPIVRYEGPDADAFASMFPLAELPAGDGALLDIAFTPQRRGPNAATLSIAACASCPPATVALSGTGLSAEIAAVPDRLDFGVVSPGGFRTLELTLENVGELAGTIESARAGDPAFRIEARSWPIALDPGEAVPVWITFEPEAIGDRATEATFVGTPGIRIAAALAGHGGGAVLEVDGAVDLGRLPLGWSGLSTTVVRNVGEAEPVTVVEARVEGSGAWRLAEPAAGLEVGLRPGTIRLAFEAGADGRADGELVISTTDREQPELRIPLRAEVVSEPACRIVATPAPLRFGLVKRGSRHLRDLVLASVGSGTCLVWDLRLAPGSDPDFSLPSAGAPFLEIPPGERVPVPVAFLPDAITGALQRATLAFRTSNASDPPAAVEITGYAADLELVATPNPLDFGRVPLERAPHRTVRVENRGSLAATLTGHALATGSSPRFSVQGGTAYPATLARNQGVDYEVTYDPDRVERNLAVLEVRVAGHPEPLVIGLRGEGHDGPCGDYCEPPVPVCPAGRSVIVNRPVALDGTATDPNGDPVTCRWEVIDAPEGSTETPAPPDACGTTFVPDAIGDYLLRLTAADDLGNEASCTTVLHALPPEGGLWVEMYWEHNSNDIDLHLLHGGGGDPRFLSSWNTTPWDCYYRNDPASWDAPGSADDANLDRDVTSGTGVENIRVDQPSTDHPYHVGIAWYSRHGGSPTTQPVVTNVYCWGIPVASTTTTIVHPGPDLPQKPLWFVGTVQVFPDGTCGWTPDGRQVH